MRLIFCGTPAFAVPTFEALLGAGHEIVLVVSQPDRPVGRSQALTSPPVKVAALSAGLAIAQPDKIRNNAAFRAQLEALAPDAIIVVAYGRIIPPWMLSLPRFGCVNLHGSLLPKYRGAAPIQWAVANGDAVTGNTTMLLEEGLDTGPILLQQTIEIGPEQSSIELFEVMAHAGAPLVVETLDGLSSGAVHPQEQNHKGATFAPILDREDGRMDFSSRTAREIFNRWRGFQPWPGAFTTLDGKKLIVHRMMVGSSFDFAEAGSQQVVASDLGAALPGQVCTAQGRLFVCCAEDTWLELIEVQLEGKKRMTSAEFLRGTSLPAEVRLGSPSR